MRIGHKTVGCVLQLSRKASTILTFLDSVAVSETQEKKSCRNVMPAVGYCPILSHGWEACCCLQQGKGSWLPQAGVGMLQGADLWMEGFSIVIVATCSYCGKGDQQPCR